MKRFIDSLNNLSQRAAMVQKNEKNMKEGESMVIVVHMKKDVEYKIDACKSNNVKDVSLCLVDDSGNPCKPIYGDAVSSIFFIPDKEGAYQVILTLNSTWNGSRTGIVKTTVCKLNFPAFYNAPFWM
ncbi:MAG: hypothetical protein NT178_18820 [Proteobacteria bacterium]|nr:hypothetical protein [Pseudomonadota bacterium]